MGREIEAQFGARLSVELEWTPDKSLQFGWSIPWQHWILNGTSLQEIMDGLSARLPKKLKCDTLGSPTQEQLEDIEELMLNYIQELIAARRVVILPVQRQTQEFFVARERLQ